STHSTAFLCCIEISSHNINFTCIKSFPKEEFGKTPQTELVVSFNGILKVECAVFPLSSKRDATPLEATAL
ncbi:hypothetical protein PPACK8108_LOCUS24963, partial [Phakopsora pachyrhizi]